MLRDQQYLKGFFQRYDSLQQEASDLIAVQAVLKTLEDRHTRLDTEAKNATSELQRNAACIDEQENRIQLVSTHWFYGTTALQPQLWFRGGCRGKISRAKAKLANAIERVPELERNKEAADINERLAHMEKESHQAVVDRKQEAADECASMHESVVQEHASPPMRELEQQLAKLQESKETVYVRVKELGQIRDSLSQAETSLRSADRDIDRAERLFRNATRLIEEEEQLVLSDSRVCIRDTVNNGPTTAADELQQRRIQLEEKRKQKRYELERALEDAEGSLSRADIEVNAGIEALQDASKSVVYMSGGLLVGGCSGRAFSEKHVYACSPYCSCCSEQAKISRRRHQLKIQMSVVSEEKVHLDRLRDEATFAMGRLEEQIDQVSGRLTQEKKRIFCHVRLATEQDTRSIAPGTQTIIPMATEVMFPSSESYSTSASGMGFQTPCPSAPVEEEFPVAGVLSVEASAPCDPCNAIRDGNHGRGALRFG